MYISLLRESSLYALFFVLAVLFVSLAELLFVYKLVLCKSRSSGTSSVLNFPEKFRQGSAIIISSGDGVLLIISENLDVLSAIVATRKSDKNYIMYLSIFPLFLLVPGPVPNIFRKKVGFGSPTNYSESAVFQLPRCIITRNNITVFRRGC